MILRVAFNKKSYLKYIGHLDLMRLFQRTFNKANIYIKYSQGFNPHPKFSIANPMSLGIESEEEYMDIELIDNIPVEEFKDRMNKALPLGIEITRGEYIEDTDAVASLIAWAFYEITIKIKSPVDKELVDKSIADYLSKDEINILKKKKKKGKRIETKVNIRSFIGNINIKVINGDKITLEVLLRSGGNGNLNPNQFIDSLNEEEILEIKESFNIKRISQYAEKEGKIYKPI